MTRKLAVVLIVALLVAFGFQRSTSASDLTAEEELNKKNLEWVFAEGVNKQNPDAWDRVTSPDYIRYCDAMPPELQVLRGLETMKKFLAEHFAAFPDWNEQIIQMVVQDDKIAVVSIATGTMTGKMGPFEPTGGKVKITDIMIFRFVDGMIVESWITWDNVSFMTQVGLMPPPEAHPADIIPPEGDSK